MKRTNQFQTITETFIVSALFLFNSPLFSAEPTPLNRKIQFLDHSVTTLDQEMATLRQKFDNQDLVLDSIHREVSSLIQATRENQSKSESSATARLKVMEKNIEKLASDLKQFKTHASDSSDLFSKIQKNLKKQDELIQIQAEQITALESAVRLLASAMQGKVKTSSSDYEVKSGDTLEKIAKAHGITIDELKRKNNLEKTTIFPGQKLQIP